MAMGGGAINGDGGRRCVSAIFCAVTAGDNDADVHTSYRCTSGVASGWQHWHVRWLVAMITFGIIEARIVYRAAIMALLI